MKSLTIVKVSLSLVLMMLMGSLLASAAPCPANVAVGYFKNFTGTDITATEGYLEVHNLDKGTVLTSDDSNQVYIGSTYFQVQLGNAGDTSNNNCYAPGDMLEIIGYDNSTGDEKSVLWRGNHSGAGNFMITLISNEPPTIDSLTLDQTEPVPSDTLNCNYGGYEDLYTPKVKNNSDNNASATPLEEYYTWYKNGAFYSDSEGSSLALTGISSPDDNFSCAVKFYDGMDNSSTYYSSNSAVVQDFPLTLEFLLINDSYVDSTEDALCEFSFLSGLSSILVNVTWSKNGVANFSEQFSCSVSGVCNSTLPSQYTQRGQGWSCEVSPSTDGGTTWLGPYTDSISINNSVPGTSLVPVNPANDGIYDRNPALAWEEAIDNDGDSVNYQIYGATDSGFADVFFNETVSNNGSVIDGVALSAHTDDLVIGNYYWKVRVVDSYGDYGNWTSIDSFEVLPVNFTMNLKEEYNLVSLPCVVENTSSGEAFYNVSASKLIDLLPEGVVSSITRWDAVNQQYPLPVCKKIGPSYVGCDFEVNVGEGIYLELYDAVNFSCTGRPIEEINMTFSPGYNLVGWNDVTQNVMASDFVGMFPTGAVSSIAAWDPVQQQYPLPVCKKMGPSYVGCDFNMTKNQAYFVKMESAHNFSRGVDPMDIAPGVW